MTYCCTTFLHTVTTKLCTEVLPLYKHFTRLYLSALHVLSVHISISPFYFAICHIPLPVHVLHVCTDSFGFNMICFFRHSFWNHTMQTNRFKVGISISLNSTFLCITQWSCFPPSLSLLPLSHGTHLQFSAEPVKVCVFLPFKWLL